MRRKQYLLLVVFTVTAGLIGGAVSSQLIVARSAVAQDMAKVITAQEFRLLDEEGKLRSIWSVHPVLDIASLLFIDKDGKRGIAVMEERLLVPDKDGQTRASISLDGLLVLDKDEKIRASVRESGFQVLDEDMKIRLSLSKNVILSWEDKKGKTRGLIGMKDDAESVLLLFDKDGELIWSAP